MPKPGQIINDLLARHRWTIFSMAQNGKTSDDIAAALGCTNRAATRAANKMNLKLAKKPKYAPHPPHPSHVDKQHRDYWPQVIELREQGLTYQEIGNAFGVSRERVRQVLHMMGRTDLLGPGGSRARDKPIYTCQQCSEAFQRSKYSAFCSADCAVAFRAKHYYERDLPRAEQIVARRESGKAWKDVAAWTGFAGPSECEMFLINFSRKHNRPDLLERSQGMRHKATA